MHPGRFTARSRPAERSPDRYSTHVVVASDHGESFGEQGAIAHGKRLTEEQIRVPLVILSTRLEPGMRGDVAGSVDVAPTPNCKLGPSANIPVGLERDAIMNQGGFAFVLVGGQSHADLAVVLDAWSRRVVGWAMETHLRTE